MTTFGLVHGAYHGSWCWEPLIKALHSRGHDALTVDLPAEDPEAGAAAYAAVAAAAFAEAGDDLTLVGHSLGGLTLPLIACDRPVARMVFLSALLPHPGRSFDDVMAHEPDMSLPGPADATYISADGASHWKPDAAAAYFFSDCSIDVAQWAAAQLRGQFWRISQETTPLAEWPDVPSSYLLGSDDPVINPVWSRRVAQTVLGVPAVELRGGHSTFLSSTEQLAEFLVSAMVG